MYLNSRPANSGHSFTRTLMNNNGDDTFVAYLDPSWDGLIAEYWIEVRRELSINNSYQESDYFMTRPVEFLSEPPTAFYEVAVQKGIITFTGE